MTDLLFQQQQQVFTVRNNKIKMYLNLTRTEDILRKTEINGRLDQTTNTVTMETH